MSDLGVMVMRGLEEVAEAEVVRDWESDVSPWSWSGAISGRPVEVEDPGVPAALVGLAVVMVAASAPAAAAFFARRAA